LLAIQVGYEGARPADGVLRVADPRSDGGTLVVRVNPALTPAQNANALYGRARNIEKGRAAFETRRADAARRRQEAETALKVLRGARSLEDLPRAEEPTRRGTVEGARPRFLTSRGLEIVFGRNAAENHETTFGIARREDLWFHVLDAPGAHVILRNRDGRANQEDIQETAAVAAFLSERRTEAKVDVQYTERKHVHPAGGGKGRVRVTHAEVIRVAPLDPAARLRAR
jgi:predicted ribosome quality control (RQC) complex YloA/Tae2 family protein